MNTCTPNAYLIMQLCVKYPRYTFRLQLLLGHSLISLREESKFLKIKLSWSFIHFGFSRTTLLRRSSEFQLRLEAQTNSSIVTDYVSKCNGSIIIRLGHMGIASQVFDTFDIPRMTSTGVKPGIETNFNEIMYKSRI